MGRKDRFPFAIWEHYVRVQKNQFGPSAIPWRPDEQGISIVFISCRYIVCGSLIIQIDLVRNGKSILAVQSNGTFMGTFKGCETFRIADAKAIDLLYRI